MGMKNKDRIKELEAVIADWLDCYDTPEEWMRCRNNAKKVLGRSADPDRIEFKKDIKK